MALANTILHIDNEILNVPSSRKQSQHQQKCGNTFADEHFSKRQISRPTEQHPNPTKAHLSMDYTTVQQNSNLRMPQWAVACTYLR